MNNKILLYNTGNNIEYPLVNHSGKEYKSMCVCVCVYIYVCVCVCVCVCVYIYMCVCV